MRRGCCCRLHPTINVTSLSGTMNDIKVCSSASFQRHKRSYMATCSYVGVTNLLNYDVQPSIVYFHLASYVVLFICTA